MSQQASAAVPTEAAEAILWTFVQGRVSKRDFRETDEGVGVCRLIVVGEAAGPASKPPRVSLYIRDGGDLRPDEARRCAFNLNVGDLIQAVGNVGAERDTALHQEIIVTERVRRRAVAVAA